MTSSRLTFFNVHFIDKIICCWSKKSKTPSGRWEILKICYFDELLKIRSKSVESSWKYFEENLCKFVRIWSLANLNWFQVVIKTQIKFSLKFNFDFLKISSMIYVFFFLSYTGRNDSTEPVRLTPAWEARNLPNDELNFKGMTMERAKMEIEPPSDRYKMIFFILLLHGIGTLTPWNMFITAADYFEKYKLGGGDSNATLSDNDLWYAKNFMPFIGFASQIPNVLFNWLNIFVNLG